LGGKSRESCHKPLVAYDFEGCASCDMKSCTPLSFLSKYSGKFETSPRSDLVFASKIAISGYKFEPICGSKGPNPATGPIKWAVGGSPPSKSEKVAHPPVLSTRIAASLRPPPKSTPKSVKIRASKGCFSRP